MRRTLGVIALACLAHVSIAGAPPPMKYEIEPYEPVASTEATVLSSDGKARFTVLTDRLIRMEYSESGSFEDRPSIAFVNRNVTVPKFTQSTAGGVTITTSAVQLKYSGGNFSASSLSVAPAPGAAASSFTGWNGGQASADDSGNLLGTFRTLDGTSVVSLNCTENQKQHCEWGLISRSGWALVDDSDTPVLDGDDWWTDTAGNLYHRQSSVDWYGFFYGNDYKGALAAYRLVGGKIPIPPKPLSGIWWTRWYDLNQLDTRKVVSDYESRFLPLDVFVLDMDWHQKAAWGGYSWDRHLFPIPDDAMAWMHEQGLWVAANQHDATGMNNYEDLWNQFCAVIGIDPNSTDTVPCDWGNKTYVYALQDVVYKNLFGVDHYYGPDGIDFPWLDWQQGESGYGCAGGKMNPTIWSDKVVHNDWKRWGQNRRGAMFGRFGGLGNHRYPVGFSGDVAGLTWENLAFQPYFSLTSSNVGWGWSHDIEGPGTDHEMYVRWVQWAAWSTVLRSHDRGMSAGGCKNPWPTADQDEVRCSLVQFWNVPHAYFEANRAAVQDRARLLPYIYTQWSNAFETGLQLLRPMYYEFADEDMAYAADYSGNFAQYFFGQDMFAAPVVKQANQTTQLADVTIWIPPGNWVERDTGKVLKGGSKVLYNKMVPLSEVPVFVRAGAVIPSTPLEMGKTTGRASKQYDALIFSVYPGENSGSGSVYEDDGLSYSYVGGGASATTTASYVRSGLKTVVTIATAGSFSELPAQRAYSIEMVNSAPASSVDCSGKALPYSRWGAPSTWTYDGNTGSLIVDCPASATSSQLVVTIVEAFAAPDEIATRGLKGIIRKSNLAKRNLDETRVTPGAHNPDPAYMTVLSTTGDLLSYQAGTDLAAFQKTVGTVLGNLQSAIAELKTMEPIPYKSGMLLQMSDAGRADNILCGTEDCVEAQGGDYTDLRIEGYQPDSSDPNATPLADYWDAAETDNWASTASSAPDGYTAATFSNGYLLKTQEEGSVPVYCYWSVDYHDHLVVASPDGIKQAESNHYSFCGSSKEDSVIGYAYSKPQGDYISHLGDVVGDVDDGRLDYSINLLEQA